MASTLPKVTGPSALRSLKEGSRALRELKKVNPRDRFVLLYPDADYAYPGMGFKLLTNKPAENVYDQASEIVKKDVLKMCIGSAKTQILDSIENKHLASYVTSHATMAKLASEREHMIQYCKAAGGIGVGFINSLVFSGAMSFENGLDLVHKRAQAMERVAKVVPNAKLKVRLHPATRKRVVCQAAIEHCINLKIPEEIAVCSVTKQIVPSIIEIGGHEEAIKFLENEGERLFRFKFTSRILRNPEATHTDLMEPVRKFLESYIEDKLKSDSNYLTDPETCSVYSATAGRRLRITKYIKKDLIAYPVKPILVEQLLNCLFMRPRHLAQPNILIMWDKKLLDTLKKVNRLAGQSAKVLEA